MKKERGNERGKEKERHKRIEYWEISKKKKKRPREGIAADSSLWNHCLLVNGEGGKRIEAEDVRERYEAI